MTETVIDTRGYPCPLPVLRARRALRSLPPGGRLIVLSTDPAALLDFEALCATTGDVFIGHTAAGGEWRIEIQRGG